MNTDNYYLLVILVVLVALAAVLFVWLRRDRALPGDDRTATPTTNAAEPDLRVSAAEALVDPIAPIAPEAIGIEPVRPAPAPKPAPTPAQVIPDPIVAPAPAPRVAGPADTLTTMKGLGPKAAARLNDLGITRYDQVAALSGDALAAIDTQMGAFQGRILRDRWVEQAGHLATGDIAGFEAKFGKIGG